MGTRKREVAIATIIDALCVTLSLDPAKFKKAVADTDKDLDKINKGAKKTGSEVDGMGKKSAQAINKIRQEVLSLGAAFIGMSAIKAFISDVTRADAATGRMSANVNLSSKNLTTWQNVAERMGVSASEISGDFEGITQAAMKFKLTNEGGEQFRWLQSLGLQLTDAKGNLKKLDEFDLEVAAKMDSMLAAGKSRAELRTYLMGSGYSSGHADMLLTGADSLRKRAAESAPYAITDKDKANANELQNSWNLMAEAAGRVGRDMLDVIEPALKSILDLMREHMGVILPIGLALTALSALKFVGLVAGINSVGTALTGALGSAGNLAMLLGRLGLVGAAGAGAFELGRWIGEKTGLDGVMGSFGSKIYDWTHAGYNPNGMPAGAASPGGAAGAPAGGAAALFAGLERQFGLPTGLLDSLWAQESGRGKKMLSPVGAKGHFQFMDATAKAYGLKNPDDLGESAGAAAHMMADLLRQYHGNLGDALTAYNGGGAAVGRFHRGTGSQETMRYAPSIMGRMGRSGGGSTTDVQVGSITIHTQATDAKGIATDIGGAMQDYAFASQANTGLQ